MKLIKNLIIYPQSGAITKFCILFILVMIFHEGKSETIEYIEQLVFVLYKIKLCVKQMLFGYSTK